MSLEFSIFTLEGFLSLTLACSRYHNLQVYKTMKITTLSRMIPFSDFFVVEKLSVDVVKYNIF